MSQSLTEFVTMPMKREELDTFPVVELEAMTEVDKETYWYAFSSQHDNNIECQVADLYLSNSFRQIQVWFTP